MSVLEHNQTLSTTLMRRFTAVRGGRAIEDIAKDMGVGFVTLYAWLAQDRMTRVGNLAKIEAWVERQEATHALTHP